MTDQVNEAWERVASVRNHVHSMSKSPPDEWQDFANEIVNELSAAYQAGINTHPARGVVDEGTPSSRWAANGEADPYGTAYDCERAALAMGDLTDDELANAVFMHGDQRPSVEDLVSGKALLPGVYLTAAKDRIRWLSRKLQAAQPAAPAFDMLAHLQRQREWSGRTFGPGPRTAGVIDHIRKELREIEADPTDLSEWIDVVILALDGAWRAGGTPEQIIAALVAKQTKNEGRTWPDWRTSDPDKAIEHDRTQDAQPAVPYVPDGMNAEAVGRVTWHISKAIEYIEKQYPNGRTLDRGPIIRNMRRWHAQLLAATPKDQPAQGVDGA